MPESFNRPLSGNTALVAARLLFEMPGVAHRSWSPTPGDPIHE